MPTVVVVGRFKFMVNTRELPYEPPHVHVRIGNEDDCRIDLTSGRFMDEPPAGDFRPILEAYALYAEDIRRIWSEIHQTQERE